jgi:hypothetical protein
MIRDEAEKPLHFKLTVRVFGRGEDYHVSHSLCMDDINTGLSPPVGEIYVDVSHTTIHRLRRQLEYDTSNFMDRRSLIFQEVLFLMEKFPNHTGRGKQDMKKYVIGFISREPDEETGERISFIVPNEMELMPVIASVNTNELLLCDMILFPLTQIQDSEISSLERR